MLYVVQFLLWPLISQGYWYVRVIQAAFGRSTYTVRRISLFLGNTLYAVAFGYYTIICFLGYNGTLSYQLEYLTIHC